MALGTTLSAPYFSGTASSVDDRYDVALGGHGFMIDTEFLDQFGSAPLDMIRAQSDTSDQPGEATLNPSGLWRRAQDDWSHGSGQDWLDKPNSDRARFRTSKGVDPWTRYGLTLLPDTSNVASSVQTNLYLTTTGTRIYRSSAFAIANSVDGITFNACTGVAGTNVTSLASDGVVVYAGYAAAVYKTTSGAPTVFASHITGGTAINLVRYIKGRLIVADGPSLYNPIAAGAIAGLLITHANPSFSWVDACPGQGFIYAMGFSGDKTLIYKATVKTDGTAMDAPSVAGELPDGEIGRSITGYLGFLVVGTDKGVRFAVADGDGNLTLGALIPTASPVYCAEGQDRFVWFGWTNYDTASTGLGRLDLSTFTEPLTPAYATDLMATGQGTVQSVVTFQSKRYFTVSASGVFGQSATKVATGTLSSGKVTFGLPDRKTALALDVRHDALPASASVTVALAADGGTSTTVGVSDTDNTTSSSPEAFNLNQRRGTFFEWTTTLAGTVTLRRLTLRADPSAERTILYTVPILLTESEDAGPVELWVDVAVEKAYLVGLCKSRDPFTYQEAGQSIRAVMEDFQWKSNKKRTADRSEFQGTFLARLKEV